MIYLFQIKNIIKYIYIYNFSCFLVIIYFVVESDFNKETPLFQLLTYFFGHKDYFVSEVNDLFMFHGWYFNPFKKAS